MEPVLQSQSRLDILFGSMFSGKCLKVGTRVMLFDGSIVNVEQLTETSVLMGDDFGPRTISNIHRGTGRLFTISPAAGAPEFEPFTVNEHHILVLTLAETFLDTCYVKGKLIIRFLQNHKFVQTVVDSISQAKAYFHSVPHNSSGDTVEIGVMDFMKQPLDWQCLYRGYKVTSNSSKRILSTIKVTESDPGPFVGFTINGNHRFLLADQTVTHNSSALLRKLSQMAEMGLHALYINHGIDDRSNTHYSTHSPLLQGQTFNITTVKVMALNELQESYLKQFDVIGIDEAQFFDASLVPFVRDLVEKHHKYVIVVGLDGNYRREKFGHILDLIPLADNVAKLHAYCKKCAAEKKILRSALFTKYDSGTSDASSDIIIGGSEKYQAVCRECYLNTF